MAKIESIRCGVCNTLFAACRYEYRESDWFKDCAKYVKMGHKIQTEESSENMFEEPLKKCCGKKIINIIENA
jgi:hypothetical protein